MTGRQQTGAQALERDEFARALTESMTPLQAAARSMAGSGAAAEDLAQTTLTKAWAARKRYVAGTNFKAWLMTIMRNQNRSEHRRKRPDGDYDPMVAAETLSRPAEAEMALRLSETRQDMAKLPAAQRNALFRVAVLGLSCEEAAQKAGCAPGSVKSRVSRARAALGHC